MHHHWCGVQAAIWCPSMHADSLHHFLILQHHSRHMMSACEPGGVQVRPPANPRVLAQIDSCHAIVYGIGSLFTSICPTLVLQVSMFSTSLMFIMLVGRLAVTFT